MKDSASLHGTYVIKYVKEINLIFFFVFLS